MFWNLISQQYERYHLQHLFLLLTLMLYSYLGALVFCRLEGPQEELRIAEENREKVRRSVAAKQVLVEKVQALYFTNTSNSEFYETKLRIALDQYDILMNTKPTLNFDKKWSLWGGLYYAGTIYTTIGYGDLAAETTAGRVVTMLYAIFGIPLVVIILNDWGTLMFNTIDGLWKKYFRPFAHFLMRVLRKKQQRKSSTDETLYLEVEEKPQTEEDLNENEPTPLFLVVIFLLFWVSLCTFVFAYLENWSLFEAIYFFFISLTTIGFGDVTPSPRVAVANFLLIMIGLSVVSMAINVIQMQLEMLFVRIIKSIENDFKANLSISGEESKKVATSGDGGDVEMGPSTVVERQGDIATQYGDSMASTDRLIMRFMSHHQRQMLNEKFEDRAKMRNKWTQTMTQIKIASVQTADKYEDLLNFPEEEEQPKTKSRINAKRLYIYNTGE